MKYQNLFSGNNKKNCSTCRLLEFLPSMQIISKHFKLQCINKFFLNENLGEKHHSFPSNSMYSREKAIFTAVEIKYCFKYYLFRFCIFN